MNGSFLKTLESEAVEPSEIFGPTKNSLDPATCPVSRPPSLGGLRQRTILEPLAFDDRYRIDSLQVGEIGGAVVAGVGEDVRRVEAHHAHALNRWWELLDIRLVGRRDEGVQREFVTCVAGEVGLEAVPPVRTSVRARLDRGLSVWVGAAPTRPRLDIGAIDGDVLAQVGQELTHASNQRRHRGVEKVCVVFQLPDEPAQRELRRCAANDLGQQWAGPPLLYALSGSAARSLPSYRAWVLLRVSILLGLVIYEVLIAYALSRPFSPILFIERTGIVVTVISAVAVP